MSNANTGLWSAFGTLFGGAAGAFAGRYAALSRPRSRLRGGAAYTEIEDAMMIGGATGAVLGSFLSTTLAAEEPPAKAVLAAPASSSSMASRFP